MSSIKKMYRVCDLLRELTTPPYPLEKVFFQPLKVSSHQITFISRWYG
jgi:hypothetical protein